MSKMSGLPSCMGMLPGMTGAQMQKMKNAKRDDGVVKRQLAMLSSMTSDERKKPDLIKASRKQRIAVGSGTSVQDVNKLLKQHKDTTRIMKRVKKMGKKGMLAGGLGGLMGGGNHFS